MIIGICGLIGSGKDTIADYLVTFHGFRRESFAGSLKDAISDIFGWDRVLLEGRTREAREWREQVDPWWAERLGIPSLTPRWILQYWGTEVGRQGFHDDIWVASLENKLRSSRDNIVISDCRFPNEISAIRRSGGIIVRVVRGPDPEWWQFAQEQNQHMTATYPDVHASEWSWANQTFDTVIDNNGTITELYDRLSGLVQDLPVSRVNLL